MLYFLSLLSDGGDVFNIFRYITFRAGGAFFTSLIIFFTFGKFSINFLKKTSKRRPTDKRRWTKGAHYQKSWYPYDGWSDHIIGGNSVYSSVGSLR